MSPDTAIPFADAKYVNLRSFKRDGSPIDTPVWFGLVGGRIVIFTDGTSYKVKRIRRNAKIELARCGARGQLLGPWLPGRCRVVEGEPELIQSAYDALNSKYVLMRVLTVIATIGGRVKRRLILEATLDAAAPASQAS